MIAPDTLNVLAIVIGGGGIIGGIVAAFKLKPETQRIIVSAAEGAVIVQTKVITSLENQVERLQQEHEVCQDEVNELRDLLDLINERKVERRRRQLATLPEEVADGDPPTGDEDGDT